MSFRFAICQNEQTTEEVVWCSWVKQNRFMGCVSESIHNSFHISPGWWTSDVHDSQNRLTLFSYNSYSRCHIAGRGTWYSPHSTDAHKVKNDSSVCLYCPVVDWGSHSCECHRDYYSWVNTKNSFLSYFQKKMFSVEVWTGYNMDHLRKAVVWCKITKVRA